MNSNLEQQLNQLLTSIESMKDPDLDDLNAYDSGLALGTYNGMTMLASQVRALMADKPQKPLTMGCLVRVTQGPYKDQKGFYQGLVATPVGAQAEVLLELLDLPVEVKQEYIEVV